MSCAACLVQLVLCCLSCACSLMYIVQLVFCYCSLLGSLEGFLLNISKTRSGEPAPPGSPSVSQPVPPASGDQFPKPKDPKQKFPSEGSLFAHVKVTCNLPWTCCMLHVAVLLPHKGKKETRHANREKRTAQPPSFIEFHLETRPRARINETKRFPS